jgi:hypothetical protein
MSYKIFHRIHIVVRVFRKNITCEYGKLSSFFLHSVLQPFVGFGLLYDSFHILLSLHFSL